MAFSTERLPDLDYNLEPFAGTGTIPEPTDVRLAAFRDALGHVAVEQLGLPRRRRSLARLAEDLGEIDPARLANCGELTDAFADLCAGHPSRGDLAVLPAAMRVSFFGWLLGLLAYADTGLSRRLTRAG